jgi:hypothetical protein
MSDASSIPGLDARLDRLEGQVRSLKRLLLIALAAIVAAFGAGAASAAQKNLTFADAQGHTRVKIDASGIQMFDASGRRRMLVGFNQSAKPSFYLQDARGNYVLGEYISDKDQPVIRLADEQNIGRAYFGLTADKHQPRIEFDDAQNNQRLYVGLTDESTGLVRTYTSGGKDQTSLEQDKIWVTDGSGNNRIYLGSSSSGDGILKMYDAGSRERIYAGVFTDETAGFQSLDGSGNVVWSSTPQ